MWKCPKAVISLAALASQNKYIISVFHTLQLIFKIFGKGEGNGGQNMRSTV